MTHPDDTNDVECDLDITDFDSFDEFAIAVEAMHDVPWTVTEDMLREPDELLARIRWHCSRHCANATNPLMRFGDYEVSHRIGTGSFGYVFLGRDPELDREVAIKLCKIAEDEHRDSLLREAQLIAKLSHHPNIVTIYELDRYQSDRDGDEFDGAPFIVMELAVGLPGEGDFPTRTAKGLIHKQLRWEDCVDFYRAAGRGLAAAHAEGIVHGDFKPSNVLIGKRGAMVSDFGLAHTLGSAEGHAGGTDGYRAPELYDVGGNSPKADQFAFCAALWELIVGTLPVDEETGEARPCPLGVMPNRLILALLRGLSADPEDRWTSMDELLEELDQLQAMSRVRRPRRPRLPGGFLLYTFLGGLVVGALVVALLMGRSKPSPQLRGYPASGPSAKGTLRSEKPDDIPIEESDADVFPPEESDTTPEPQQSDVPPDQSGAQDEQQSACALAEETLDPSPELEMVCRMIREGKLQGAAQKWKQVREGRSDDQQVLAETKVVFHTCEDFRLKTDDEALANDAQDVSDQLREAYLRDREELSSSQ